jgi:hypothetical protein
VPLCVRPETAGLIAQANRMYGLDHLQVLAWDDYFPGTAAMAE